MIKKLNSTHNQKLSELKNEVKNLKKSIDFHISEKMTLAKLNETQSLQLIYYKEMARNF